MKKSIFVVKNVKNEAVLHVVFLQNELREVIFKEGHSQAYANMPDGWIFVDSEYRYDPKTGTIGRVAVKEFDHIGRPVWGRVDIFQGYLERI